MEKSAEQVASQELTEEEATAFAGLKERKKVRSTNTSDEVWTVLQSLISKGYAELKGSFVYPTKKKAG